MELYEQAAGDAARLVTNRYSTSFSLACRLFEPTLRQHIYNIYGLVRLADEIVDTYRGPGQREILDALEAEVYAAITRRYSSNLIVHAFAGTANWASITAELIKPFFASMRHDIDTHNYAAEQLSDYIYGSAEVVGLMCLRAFVGGDTASYVRLKPGAQALGAAFQKVNFLRDLAADHAELGRTYLPAGDWAQFDDAAKRTFETDIAADFAQAKAAIAELPASSRPAVQAAYTYYLALFRRLQATPAAELKTRRVRLPNAYKLWLLAGVFVSGRLRLGARS